MHDDLYMVFDILPVFKCGSTPCMNNGICNEGLASYTCACTVSYTGTHCETGEKSNQYWIIASLVQLQNVPFKYMLM